MSFVLRSHLPDRMPSTLTSPTRQMLSPAAPLATPLQTLRGLSCKFQPLPLGSLGSPDRPAHHS